MKSQAGGNRRKLGAYGEALAEQRLCQDGYRIAARNWRCRTGEIDLIAEREGTVVFVEVRTRTDTGTRGTAKEALSARKQVQVRETARTYLYMHKIDGVPIRFDAVCITLNRDGTVQSLEHIPHAF